MPANNDVITRDRTLEFSALNITAQPHPEGSYAELFTAARKLRRAFKIAGQDYAELSPISFEKDDSGDDIITGSIYRFTKIDESADWFDTSTGETATDDALELLSIPKNLRPNTRVIHWVFDITSHTLVFVKKNGSANLSPDQAASYFGKLMNEASLRVSSVEYVDVTTVKSAEAIDRIFRKDRVSTLTIDIKRPNPDGPQKAAAKIFKAMKEECARRRVETLTAANGESIKKSERVDELLQASVSNGRAEAVTYNASGEKEVIDTNQHPIVERKVYSPFDKVPLLEFITGVAVAMVVAIRIRRK